MRALTVRFAACMQPILSVPQEKNMTLNIDIYQESDPSVVLCAGLADNFATDTMLVTKIIPPGLILVDKLYILENVATGEQLGYRCEDTSPEAGSAVFVTP